MTLPERTPLQTRSRRTTTSRDNHPHTKRFRVRAVANCRIHDQRRHESLGVLLAATITSRLARHSTAALDASTLIAHQGSQSAAYARLGQVGASLSSRPASRYRCSCRPSTSCSATRSALPASSARGTALGSTSRLPGDLRGVPALTSFHRLCERFPEGPRSRY